MRFIDAKGMEKNNKEQWTELYRLLQKKKDSLGEHLEEKRKKKTFREQKWTEPLKSDRRRKNFKKKNILEMSKAVENRAMVSIFDYQNEKS